MILAVIEYMTEQNEPSSPYTLRIPDLADPIDWLRRHFAKELEAQDPDEFKADEIAKDIVLRTKNCNWGKWELLLPNGILVIANPEEAEG